MPISDIFNSPFLICLGICLLLLGLLGMYFTQKLSEQNHKITSMFEIVSTMAEEMNVIRSNVMIPQFRPKFNAVPSFGGQNSQLNSKPPLLPVSDDDEEDDEDEEDEEDEEDDEDEDEDEEDDEDDDEDDDSDNELKIKSINFDNLEASTFNLGDEIENLEETQILEDDDDDNDDDDNDDDENEDDDEENEDTDEEKELHFEQDETTDLKTINIPILTEPKNFEVIDYKKLSLQKLKSLVTEKGFVTDASKMKKNDLLKLLGSD